MIASVTVVIVLKPASHFVEGEIESQSLWPLRD